MATDGIKIIDGDLARDTYNGIMDLYDSNASIEIIKAEFPFIKSDFGADTEFYHEIFVTAYALAFWEIGELKDHMINEVKKTISLKAGVKVWTEECDEKTGAARQKELEKLLKKISQPNHKIRKRKKYRLITKLYFEENDVLTFQLSDKYYYAVICSKITQSRGQCTYDLAKTTYKSMHKPNISELRNCFIAGRAITSGYDSDTTLSHQPNVDEIWEYLPNRSNFIFGIAYSLVTHSDMINLKHQFEVIGKLKIKDSFRRDGGYGYITSFDGFDSIFSDLKNHMKVFGEQEFPVSLLCE